MSWYSKIQKAGLLLVLMLLASEVFASSPEAAQSDSTEHHGFDIGHFTFHHIGDSYDWSIAVIGGREIAIPLPVLVKSQDRGWFCFSSVRLRHGANYEGFVVNADNKIMETLPDGSQVRPWDFSITKNVCSLFISSFFLCFIFLSIAKRYKKSGLVAPKGMQGILEPIILFVHDDIIKPSIGKNYKKFVPYLMTVFFFILLNNLLGLIPIFPGGANLTGNIAVPLVLALCTFLVINIFGTREYWKEIFWPDVPVWMKIPVPLMPVVEFMSILIKPVALMVRLFANMMSGHVVVLVLLSMIFLFSSMSPLVGSGASIVSVIFSIFMTVLDLLVSLIQAYVFTLFSAIFIGMAQVEGHHHKEEKAIAHK